MRIGDRLLLVDVGLLALPMQQIWPSLCIRSDWCASSSWQVWSRISRSYRFLFALDLGFHQVLAETDSAEALKLIQHDDNQEGLSAIVWCIKEFCRRGWSISYFYVPRSDNRVADALATRVNTDSLELIVWRNLQFMLFTSCLRIWFLLRSRFNFMM
ncbi:hypothetical protein V6N13_081175 [Hibiscus sabdariffa]|uniref:RNase H type-1 domain-containing protein n=1 Tax=Hibiscus sabdariffa TaxID=183260 RepID=A0ABR2DBQ7_9ROSI